MAFDKIFGSTKVVEIPKDAHQQKVDLDNKYKLFFIFWSLATLFHLAHFKIFDDKFQYFLLAVGSVYLLFKPSSIIRMVIFVSLQLYEALSRLPIISNHWVFTAFVNATILFSLVYLIFKKKSFAIEKGELYTTFAPALRLYFIFM